MTRTADSEATEAAEVAEDRELAVTRQQQPPNEGMVSQSYLLTRMIPMLLMFEKTRRICIGLFQ